MVFLQRTFMINLENGHIGPTRSKDVTNGLMEVHDVGDPSKILQL